MASAREKELERRVQELEAALAKANSGSSSNVVQREKIIQVWSLLEFAYVCFFNSVSFKDWLKC